jgi:hypothetical protein
MISDTEPKITKKDVNLDVQAPEVEWKIRRNYYLKDIKKEFVIAPFQRKVNTSHVRKMVDAILSNQFYSNVIKFYTDKKGIKQVIDGQHTLEALYSCYEIHGVQNYTIVFGEYEEKFARTAFRKLNLGKILQLRDYTLALDDGTYEFFQELRPWCDHQGTSSKPTYVQLLHALNYCHGATRQAGLDQIETILKTIAKDDLELARRFSECMRTIFPVVNNSKAYRAPVYRNILKISYEKKLDNETIKRLTIDTVSNKKIRELPKMHPGLVQLEAYKIIKDEILPKVLKK